MYKRENQSFKTMKSAAGDMNQHSIACTVLTGLPRPSLSQSHITPALEGSGVSGLLQHWAPMHTSTHRCTNTDIIKSKTNS